LSSVAAHYNVVIVGTDLAGLVCGALCAKRGYRVLVVAQGPIGALYDHAGHVLCRRLELPYGLASQAARRVFDDLSLSLEARNLPRPLEPSFQVVLPGARVDVTTEPRLAERELQREFPADGAAISAFFRALSTTDAMVCEVLGARPLLPPTGVVEGLLFKSIAKKYPALNDEWVIEDPLRSFPHGHPFRALVQAPFRFASGMVPARPYPATFVRAITELWKGTACFERGPNALRDLFARLVATSGDVRAKAHVQQIVVQRGRATQVILRERKEAVSCDLLVCNTEPKRFFALIPQEAQIEDFHHQIHTLQPISYLFIGNFVVRGAAIPEAMARHVFAVADLDQSLEEDNLLHIARDVDQGAGGEERERRLITAAMRVPIGAASGGPAEVDHLLDRMQRRVEDVIPFLSDHLLFRHAPWQGWGQNEDGGADIDPAELQAAYGEAVPRTLGTSPIATLTAYKNILVGGNASFCGLGAEGPYLAGWNLYQHVTAKVALRSGF